MPANDSGERSLQRECGSTDRADRFYDRQMKSMLNATMITLIRRQEMVFVATSNARGHCDCSPRFGSQGFVQVLDAKTLAYPELRGNGVFASLGNMLENPQVGLVFIDFFETTVGLHVNGAARSYLVDSLPETLRSKLHAIEAAPNIERWVVITIDEAYIHCSKHVPLLSKLRKSIHWGTDDPVAKSNDFFIGPEPPEESVPKS